MKIVALYIYPVKACKGIAVPYADVTESGMYYDRQWMIVKEGTGRFLSQREIPKMALIETALDPEILTSDPKDVPEGAALHINAPGMQGIKILVNNASRKEKNARKVSVWHWQGLGLDEGDEAAQFFSTYLGQPCRFVRYMGSASAEAQLQGAVRQTDEEFAKGFEMRFADSFQMLLVNEAAMTDLNSQLPEPMRINRFRANVIVGEGAEAWEEDTWRELEVTGEGREALNLVLVKPAARCSVPTVEQETAVRGDQPIDLLSEIRSGKVLGWSQYIKSWTHAVFFGWMMVAPKPGRLRVGDTITPTKAQVFPLVPAVLAPSA